LQGRHASRETAPVGQQSLGRIAASVFPVTVILQLCSFGASLALASVLGASYATDAYFLGLSVPLVVFGTMLAAIRLGSIPALTEAQRSAPQRFSMAASELFTGVLVASAGLVTLVVLLYVLALPLFVSDNNGQTLPLAQLMAVELAPLGILGAGSGALGAILTVRGRFVAPVAVLCLDPILRALFVITAGSLLSVQALVAGQLAGNLLAICLLWQLVRRAGVDLRLVPFSRSPFVVGVLAFSAPLLIGQSALQVNPVIDRTMAAALPPGNVTVLDLAVGMFFVPVALLASTLIAPIAATWASRYAEEGWPALKQSYVRAVRGLVVALPPIVVLGFLLSREVLKVTYEWGAFSKSAADRTAVVFGMLLLGLPAQTLVILLSTLFVVRRDSVFPMKIALANVCLNVALNFALRPFMGVAGLALSTTLTYTILCGVYAAAARHRFGPLGLGPLRAEVTLALVATGLVAVAAVSLLALLPQAETKTQALFNIFAVSGLGIAIYFVMLGAATKGGFTAVAVGVRRLAAGIRDRWPYDV
jgi:putative peptidoglycan lipid II flippase